MLPARGSARDKGKKKVVSAAKPAATTLDAASRHAAATAAAATVASATLDAPNASPAAAAASVERQVGVPVMSCVGPREIALQPWVPVVWRCNHGSRCISVADPCILGSPRCSEVAAD